MERRNTWAERDFPILEYLVDRFEDGAAVVKNTEISDAVRLALKDIGYLARSASRRGVRDQDYELAQ